MNNNEITVKEFDNLLKGNEEYLLLDVRTDEEYQIVNLGGELLPDYDITSRYIELPKDKKILVLCHHGVRSLNVTNFLISKGFQHVFSVAGGIDKYATEINNDLARY